MQTKLPPSIYNISWKTMHQNALKIAKDVMEGLPRHQDVTIVYSDPDPHYNLEAPCKCIRRADSLFWGG